MSWSLPDGFEVRPATDADAAAVAELGRATEHAVLGVSVLDEGDIRDRWRLADLRENVWLIHGDGRLAATGTLWKYGEAAIVWGDVHPDLLGRGLGTALLELAEARARELGTGVIRNDVFARDETATALLAGRGYRPVRRYYEMRIALGDEAPPEPEWPDADDFDPEVWSIVRDGDEIAAVARCDVFRYGGGWVAALGVRQPWRRRGVGLALLRHIFRVFHARGERSVGLGVDSENPTGATRLYERAGMHVESESVMFEKELT